MPETERKTCPECGADNEGQAFCSFCGAYLYSPSYHRATVRAEIAGRRGY